MYSVLLSVFAFDEENMNDVSYNCGKVIEIIMVRKHKVMQLNCEFGYFMVMSCPL